MFGSAIIDVAIGLVFVFTFVSLVASSAAEGIEGILKTRAMDLEKGIREILSDGGGKGMTKKLFEHPLIHALFVGDYDPGNLKDDVPLPWKAPQSHMRWSKRRNLPSYIPSKSFAEALIDIVARGPLSSRKTDTDKDGAKAIDISDVKALRKAVGDIRNESLKRALLTAIDYGKDDIEKVKANLAAWFDSSMDRVSGWYKRRVQLILFIIGLVVAVVLNVDALTTATRLMNDRSLRDAIVSAAGNAVVDLSLPEATSEEEDGDGEDEEPEPQPEPGAEDAAPEQPTDSAETPEAEPEDPPETEEPAPPAEQTPAGEDDPEEVSVLRFEDLKIQFDELGFPMGWEKGYPGPQFAMCFDANDAWVCSGSSAVWVRTVLGWLVTAFAVMFGAPFWFDLLGKLVRLRGSGANPVEKKKDEGK
jgi:hypothetical protein